ncbi:hypothetical protein [Virgibacillus sp. JSM 102003]|uniref:hypothetical protein n=1 Tax=Virgibacillus sp. JSM 102003 TaxID=1562108 RepID=UPI0035C16531
MNLSFRELHNIQSMYTYYLFKQKAFKHFLTGLYVIIGMWLITAIITKGGYFLTIGVVYLTIYLFLFGMIWLTFTFVARKVEKKRMAMNLSREQFENLIGHDRDTGRMNKQFFKMHLAEKRLTKKKNVTPEEYKQIIEENSKDKITELYEQLTKGYQVDRLNKLPEFRVLENPLIYEKVGSWLGWGELDKQQKKEKRFDRYGIIFFGIIILVLGFFGTDEMSILGRIAGGCIVLYGLFSRKIGRKESKGKSSDSEAIYIGSLHYWNKSFYHVHRDTRYTYDTSFGRENIFDSTGDEKVKIVKWYNTVPPAEKGSSDTIAYVYKQNKNVYKERDNAIGIYLNLYMPDVKEFDSSISNNFYLLPSGNESKKSLYSYHSTQEGYDIYSAGEPLQKAVNHVLELVRPFTERNWEVGVEYTRGYLTIYLPEFLPDIKEIKTEAELLHVCRRVDSFYYFLKRSFIWRYGDIKKWNKSEINKSGVYDIKSGLES